MPKYNPETLAQIKELLNDDPDWILGRRYGFSLKKFREKHPDGVDDKVAAELLGIAEEDLDQIYNDILTKLKQHFKVEE